jgi:protein-disulfide isomerase
MTEHTHTSANSHTKKKKLSTENAVLISGVFISLSILAHGVLARGGATGSGIAIDKKLVSEILKKDVSHRYFDVASVSEEVVLVEYSDTECPFCKSFHSNIESVIREANGTYAWVYRHFPLSFHPKAQKQAEAIECVREIKNDEMAFRYMDLMYAITPSNNKLPDETLLEIADALKISKSKLKSCLESSKYATRVQEQIAEGVQAGVEGTPYTIVKKRVNGELQQSGVINGAQPPEVIQAIIEK